MSEEQSFIKEVFVEDIPNLHNIRELMVNKVEQLIEENNSEFGAVEVSGLAECRVPRTTNTKTHAFMSMKNLADNEWLLESLNGLRFEELTVLEARVYTRCEVRVKTEETVRELNSRVAELERLVEQERYERQLVVAAMEEKEVELADKNREIKSLKTSMSRIKEIAERH